MQSVLVLGGSGFVGLHVCEQLARAGWRVTVPTRRRSRAQGLWHLPGLTLLEGPVADDAFLKGALAGQDAVVNLVAILHGDLAAFEHMHVALPTRLAHAMQAQGVARLVHVSALGADALAPQQAPSLYLRTKSEGEAVLTQAARGAGAGGAPFDLALLRPSVIFGARDRLTNLFAGLQRLAPVLPLAGAGARFQPVWVQDVAAAVVACLQGASQPGRVRTFELGGPQVMTLAELVRTVGQVAGCARPVLSLPDWAARAQAALMSLAPGEPLMSADNLDSMKRDNVCSGTLPGLAELGIRAADLVGTARTYLR